MPNPEFQLRLVDYFGDPARWAKSFNDMLIERTLELLLISPPVRRAHEGSRHGDNGLDLNFSNRGMVEDLIDFYDSLIRSLRGLERMADHNWADDLRRWNRERVQEGQRPLREAITRARRSAERDFATLQRILVERHDVPATEAGPSGTNTIPARPRTVVADDHLNTLGLRADALGGAGREYVPLDELSRQLAETLQVEDERRNQGALNEASRRLAEEVQTEEANRQRAATTEASNRLVDHFQEEDRRAEEEASRRLAERLREETRDQRVRERAPRRLAADSRRQEEAVHRRWMDEQQDGVRVGFGGPGHQRRRAEDWRRDRPIGGGAFALRRERMGLQDDWEEERQQLLNGAADFFAGGPHERRENEGLDEWRQRFIRERR